MSLLGNIAANKAVRRESIRTNGSSIGFHVADYGAVGDGTTDDTAAINAAIAACSSAGGGVVDFDSKTYLVNGAYQGANGYKCRLPIPQKAFSNDWSTLELRGAYIPPQAFGTIGNNTLPNKGTIIKSTDQTTGGAIIGSIQEPQNAQTLIMSNMTVRTTDNPKQTAIDGRSFGQMILRDMQVDTGVYNPAASLPTTANVFGIRVPAVDNAALTILGNIVVTGYWGGIEVNEHTYGDYLNVCSNLHGLYFTESNHASHFTRVGAYRNQNALTLVGKAAFKIHQLALEHPGAGQTDPNTAWQSTDGIQGWDLNDLSDHGYGEITWWNVLGGVGANADFFKRGGTRFRTNQLGFAIS